MLHERRVPFLLVPWNCSTQRAHLRTRLRSKSANNIAPLCDLAHSYAMQGDTAKASAAYQEFLTLWKDADPDIPILKQAKAEYVKLQ
jgi:cytochrome c-type biogenesis protein CcmH/NrfG